MAQAKKKPAAEVTNETLMVAILESEKSVKADLTAYTDKMFGVLDRKIDKLDGRMDRLEDKMDSHHRWTIGLVVLVLISIVGPYLQSLL